MAYYFMSCEMKVLRAFFITPLKSVSVTINNTSAKVSDQCLMSRIWPYSDHVDIRLLTRVFTTLKVFQNLQR